MVVDQLLCFLVVGIDASAQFNNFDSTLSIVVMKILESLFAPSCVLLTISLKNADFIPYRKMLLLVGVLRNCGSLCTSKPHVSLFSLNFYCIAHLVQIFNGAREPMKQI